VAVAASALLVGCSAGSTTGAEPGVPRSSLLGLPMTAAVTPLDQVIVFKNNALAQVSMTFNDSAHTVFADLDFPPHSVPFRNDTTLADTSTITVTVSITPGTFEFTIGPSSLGFNTAGGPTIAVHYGAYSDSSVYTQSGRYASASAFSQALELWLERATDHWVEGRNSSHTGSGIVSSGLDAPGHYLLAAPK